MLKESIKKYIFTSILVILILFIIISLNIFFIEKKIEIKNFENNNFIITKNDYYVLEGNGKNFKKIEINNREIFLDHNYNFSEKFFLSDYENIFQIKAIYKNNNIIKKKIKIYKKK